MKYFADLNDENVCIGIRMVADEEAAGVGIEIESYDHDYLTREYKNGSWAEKQPIQFEPGDGQGLKVPADKIVGIEQRLDDLALMILETGGAVK